MTMFGKLRQAGIELSNGAVEFFWKGVTAYPQVPANADVEAHAATDTIVAADFGKNNTNTGASGTTVHTLPAPGPYKGKSIRFQATAAQIMQITPPTAVGIYLGGSGVATKYLNIAAVIGNYADLYSNGTHYLVTGYAGVLTKEA
jgi:hypothetical protein